MQQLSLVAGLAVAEAVEGSAATRRIKWPNDVLLGARKVPGILLEGRGWRGRLRDRRQRQPDLATVLAARPTGGTARLPARAPGAPFTWRRWRTTASSRLSSALLALKLGGEGERVYAPTGGSRYRAGRRPRGPELEGRDGARRGRTVTVGAVPGTRAGSRPTDGSAVAEDGSETLRVRERRGGWCSDRPGEPRARRGLRRRRRVAGRGRSRARGSRSVP